MELSTDDQQRIKTEEMIRLEVRKAFESQRSFCEKFWKLANSAIVLWLLSTVLVAFAGYFYSNYKESAKLTSEIENRRDVALKALAYIRKEANTEYYYGPQWASQRVLKLLDGHDDPELP